MVPLEENVSVVSLPESCPNCSLAASSEVDVTKAVALGLVLGVFVVFGVLGNILVILSVVCHRHLRSVTHYFIANLAAADLLLSAAVLPFSAASEALGRWVFGRQLCLAWAALDVLCCTASILSLCVIAVDRCLAVSYPLRYLVLATGRRGLAAVAALWGVAATISVGPLIGWRAPAPADEAVCHVNEEPAYALFSAAGSFYVPLVVILAAYCRVYVVARRAARSLGRGHRQDTTVTLRIYRGNGAVAVTEKQEGGGNGEEGAKKRRRVQLALACLLRFSREKKAAKTLGVVVGCFILCWLPFFLVLPIGSIFPSYRPSDTVFKITFWLGYLNSCINPIIYPCFSQEFKKAFQNVLRGRCLGRTARYSKPHGPRPGSLTLLHSQPPPSSSPSAPPCVPPSPSASSSSGCWGALGASSPSAGRPRHVQGHGHCARVHSKSLQKACCFTGRESSAHCSVPQPRPSCPAAPPQAKALWLTVEKEGGEAV